MSSLILLGDQPSAVDLATFVERVAHTQGLGELAKDKKSFSKLLDQVITVIAPLHNVSEDDLTTILQLSFAVLAQLSTPADASAAASKFSAYLTVDPATRTLFKTRTLSNFINILGELPTIAPAQRFATLMQLFEFTAAAAATSTAPAALVLQPLTSIASLVDYWHLSPEQTVQLYRASYRLACIPNVARKRTDYLTRVYQLGEMPTVQQDYLFALLRAIDAASASNAALLKEKSNQELAYTAAIASIQTGLNESLSTIDPTRVFPLQIVQSLATAAAVPNAATAFNLLRMIVNADIVGFAAFEKSNAAFLKENRLDTDTLTRKLRTLSLCHLAVANQTAAADNVLTYAAIRNALQLQPKEDVESAVIDAVMAGRLDAKMDQDTETLCVKRVTGGVPLTLYTGPNSKAAWAALGTRLKAWKANINTVLTTFSTQQLEQQEVADE